MATSVHLHGWVSIGCVFLCLKCLGISGLSLQLVKSKNQRKKDAKNIDVLAGIVSFQQRLMFLLYVRNVSPVLCCRWIRPNKLLSKLLDPDRYRELSFEAHR